MNKLILKNYIANFFFILAPVTFIVGNASINIFFLLSFLLLSVFYEDLILFYKKNRNCIIASIIFVLLYYLLFFYFKEFNNYKIFSVLKFFCLFLTISIYLNYSNIDLISKAWLIILSLVLIDTFYQYFNGVDFFGFKSQLLDISFCNNDNINSKNIFESITNDLVIFDNCPIYKRTLRLSGPFGNEYVVGGFLVNFSLLAIFFSKFLSNKLKFFYLLIVFILIVLSGERMSALLYLLGIMLIGIVYFRKKIVTLFIFAACFFTLSFSLVSFDKRLSLRVAETMSIVKNFKSDDNPYFALFFNSITIFEKNVFLGSGPRSFRDECLKITNKTILTCRNHPHNLYFEIVSEMGIYGLFFFIFILWKILHNSFKLLKSNNNNITLINFVSIMILIFPLKTSGAIFSTFYGNYFWFFLFFSYLFSNCRIDKKKTDS